MIASSSGFAKKFRLAKSQAINIAAGKLTVTALKATFKLREIACISNSLNIVDGSIRVAVGSLRA